MRILVLCKRQYTGRDLLDDRYGRLHALPAGLAGLGNEVVVVVTSYRRRGTVDRVEDGARWIGVDAWPWPGAVFDCWRETARALRPELVLASSDAVQLVGGERLARRLGVPVVLDLYDDYEAFGLSRLPGLRGSIRAACIRADAVLAVSGVLAEVLAARGVDPTRIAMIGNGVPEGFAPALGRAEARACLGLPLDAPLVGTAGALLRERGIDDLLQAYTRLRAIYPALRLVVAGPRDPGLAAMLPTGTIDLGLLAHRDVAILFRALDVGVVCNRDGMFAQASHPMKLVEMVTCNLPAIAADLGEVSRLLADRPDARYPAGDAEVLAARIAAQLRSPRPLDSGLAESWATLVARLAETIGRVTLVRAEPSSTERGKGCVPCESEKSPRSRSGV